MALPGTSGSGLNFNLVNNTIYNAITTQETNLQNTLNSIQTDADGNITTADMLKIQQQTQQWSLLVDMQSTITKTISDALKTVIQQSS